MTVRRHRIRAAALVALLATEMSGVAIASAKDCSLLTVTIDLLNDPAHDGTRFRYEVVLSGEGTSLRRTVTPSPVDPGSGNAIEPPPAPRRDERRLSRDEVVALKRAVEAAIGRCDEGDGGPVGLHPAAWRLVIASACGTSDASWIADGARHPHEACARLARMLAELDPVP